MKNGKYVLKKAPSDYPGKKYRGKYCYEHYLVYWQHYGVIPKEGEIIHHIDGNPCNNDISNLQLLTKQEHDLYHAGQEKSHLLLMICPTCGKPFITQYRKSHLVKQGANKHTYCSRKCSDYANTLRSKGDENYLQRLDENVVCEFYAIDPN